MKTAYAPKRWDAPFEKPPENAIREEIFSAERLEQHAQRLAAEHRHATATRAGRSLEPRVRANARTLTLCRRELGAARPAPAAAKWLLDNFHLVSAQWKSAKEELPSGYYRGLPKLLSGELKGYPRIYGVAWDLMAHCDCRFDPETLRRFIAAYQRTQPLVIGELWALPATLRIVLLENLRRQAEGVVFYLRARRRADRLADRLLDLIPGPPLDQDGVPSRLERRDPPEAFCLRLFQRLRDQDPTAAPVLDWLETRLNGPRVNPESLARAEHQDQLARDAAVENSINSFRDIALHDWPPFVESVSLVDEALAAASNFSALSFATRDRYRHTIEDLARGSRHSELEIARMAAQATLVSRPAAGNAAPEGPEADAGYHLFGPGSRAFERRILYSAPLPLLLRRAAGPLAAPLYLLSLSALTAYALVLPFGRSLGGGLPLGLATLMACLALLPASEIAVALVNHMVMRFCPPRRLPSLELKKGVPPEFRTLVVVPVLLENASDAEAFCKTLESHHLSNPDGEIFFALLSDWTDADVPERAGEAALLTKARLRVSALNALHGPGPDGEPRFALLHRRRRYNAAEGVWMGWERKRGKLEELNRLLLGSADTSFEAEGGGAPTVPAGVRFVITLDADTRLPRGAARGLVGTLAHPLNRPRLNAEGDRVVRGYGVLQPRVSPSLPPEGRTTLYNRLGSGRAGADAYASANSDVYQDLFGEGSYAGKGIYDLAAFEASLKGRTPENSMLSHDLFEGVFARAGLVSDIECYEEFPGHYQAAAARRHRWTRGDWQLLPWILGATRLGAMARWKMLDNLRRSLLAPASILALLAAWTLPPRQAGLWSAFILCALALPPLLGVLVSDLVPRRAGYSLRTHWRSLRQDLGAGLLQFLFTVATLPSEAYLAADAIVRTLYRLLISRRLLLEWTTAARSGKGLANNGPGFLLLLKAGPLAAAGVLAAVARFRPASWTWAVGLAAVWAASPALAWAFSLPARKGEARGLEPAETKALFLAARRTWHFFETFVGASVHHLPPDNFQEDPAHALAVRTSPTNIGLYVLSCVAAHDFGWLAPAALLERLERTLDSLEALEKHRGHLFNWYDLNTLKPLEPRYISTVDSGNLAGHLLVAEQALLELAGAEPDPSRLLTGMAQTLALAALEAERAESDGLTGIHGKALRALLGELADLLRAGHGGAAEKGRRDRLPALTETLLDIARSLGQEHGPAAAAGLMRWTETLHREAEAHASSPASAAPQRVAALAGRLHRAADAMRFGFLYEPVKRLFSIGYRVAEGELDRGSYDLLASEARLASYLAVARGEVETDHWFRLGRPLTPVGNGIALLSWSGSMFEYLMPLLVMPSPPGSLLSETYRAVVGRQIQFGKECGMPWGVSESAYAVRDRDMTYQYSGFGVEGLGIRPSLGLERVVAPYATALALLVDPSAAAKNLAQLDAMGAQGPYGYYDALDFEPRHNPEGRAWTLVRTNMAHHQGMSLLAFLYALKGGLMQARFNAAPVLGAAALLLQERLPKDVVRSRLASLPEETLPPAEPNVEAADRTFEGPHDSQPQTHLLGNGGYSVMLSASGGGFSRWRGNQITRFRTDGTGEAWGNFIFVRDLSDGATWSAGYLPSRKEADAYRAVFKEHKAEIIRRDGDVETRLEVLVSPEEDVELRRITLKNLGAFEKEIELTSYMELSLGPEGADLAHPAFAKLFVQTEYVPELGALLAHRRPRRADEAQVWAAHLSFSGPSGSGGIHFETDRARFLGRGRDILDPSMAAEGRFLTNTVGTVLDPIFSLRRKVTLAPGATAHVTFATMAAASREGVLALAGRQAAVLNPERLFGQAWTHAQVELRHLGIRPGEACLFQTLAGHLIYPDRRLRPPADILARNRLGARSLWGQGISGDLPILLLRLDETSDRELLRQSLLAWGYWRLKDLDVDLVVLNEEPASYSAEFQRSLDDMMRSRPDAAIGKGRGRVHALQACQLPETELNLLLCSASAVLRGRQGSLAEQLARVLPKPSPKPPLETSEEALSPAGPDEESLEFPNGLGGFMDGGREYRVALEEGQATPVPWINVVANPNFGFLASESGAGYTWAGNSSENKLTPWSNDPVSDPSGEVFYVRDEESGALWTPTALPVRLKGGRYTAFHGQGYSRFESTVQGVQMSLCQFVPPEDPVKISRLTLKNVSDRPRRLSLTAYVEWVLGASPSTNPPMVVTELAADLGLLTARNPFNPALPDAMAFLDLGGLHHSFTADRSEFLGRFGSLRRPQALATGGPLSGRVGPGMDPCGALRSTVELGPGESAEFRVLLGQASDRERMVRLVNDYRSRDLDALLAEVTASWDRTLGVLKVRTPDRAMDLMLNRWLIYQTVGCRLWARAAFYQAGGAYGFRDQLQDAAALCLARPDLTRAHLLRAAEKQFPEGDVLHWWHPPLGAGVRTRISDDRLWLPYVADHYVQSSGDRAILDETAPFVEGRALGAESEDRYFLPETSARTATLYEHCALALDRSLATGEHGLPLMGGGDWNDGMNRVGSEGKGESVWLAWFLVHVLRRFAVHAEARGEAVRAASWLRHADRIAAAAEAEGWDGDWYRRAFFDDGSPLGSSSRPECRIDSIAQSWAVLSGAADPKRAARAMAALEEYLWRKGDRIQTLLSPPFEKSRPDPGYIMGYPPGVRENGGQYNHAAAWSVAAFARLGEGDKAHELFTTLNPARQAGNRSGMQRYKAEPYVMAGDVHSQSPHLGRGGWSWYTGSAGWMYRAGIEEILGFTLHGDAFGIAPCVPRHWPGFELRLDWRGTPWEIEVLNPESVSSGVSGLELDGRPLPLSEAGRIPLIGDGKPHRLKVLMGQAEG